MKKLLPLLSVLFLISCGQKDIQLPVGSDFEVLNIERNETDVLTYYNLDILYTGIVEKTSCKRLKLKPESIEVFKINKALVDKINKQISKADGEVKKYLLKRKNRITPNIVEIHVPKSNIKFIDEIKSLIRCYNSCIVFGLLEDENKNIIPVREDLITKTLSDKLFDCLNNIGCVEIKDKNVWSY